MSADRLIKDGKVAVLYSPGFGAGWSTWNTEFGSAFVFNPEIAQMVIDGLPEAHIANAAERLWPEAYLGGLDQIKVEWVELDQRFEISEYDGSESIRYLGRYEGFVA